ncbi:MAG: MnhB domain-containing protein, partial [bacterium]
MKGMTTVVKTITKFLSPLIILFGVYIVLHGHLTPGGGFPGGVMIASCFVLLTLAYGKEIAYKKLKRSTSSVLESLGILIFLILAVLGIFVGGYFFLNFLPPGHPLKVVSAGVFPLSYIGIGLEVAGAIFAVFLALIL